MNKSKRNAVIYLKNNKYMADEKELCVKYANDNGYTVVKKYIEDEESNSLLKKMIEDSEKKEFDYVIVSSFDRFARNKYDFAIYKSILKKNGVKVKSPTQKVASDILLNSILEGMAEYYAKEIKEEKC